MKRRIEAMSTDWSAQCKLCKEYHEECDDHGSCTITDRAYCCCLCHENDHRLLIYAMGDDERTPPHLIAFKIVDGYIVRVLHARSS